MGGVEDTTKANEELVKSLEKVPALLDKINSFKKAGLISPAAANELENYLNRKKGYELYVQPDGSVGPAATRTIQEAIISPGVFSGPGTGGPVTTGYKDVQKPNPFASQDQIYDYASKTLPQVADAQVKELLEYKDAAKKINDEALTGLEKQIQLIKERNLANREALTAAAQGAGNLIGPKQLDVGTQLLLEKSLATEKREIADAEAKADAARSERFDVWVKKQGDAVLETLRQN